MLLGRRLRARSRGGMVQVSMADVRSGEPVGQISDGQSRRSVACCGFSFRLALTGAVGLLASALLCVSVLIMQHRGALEGVSGNYLARVTSQSGLEMARLEAAISAQQVPWEWSDA